MNQNTTLFRAWQPVDSLFAIHGSDENDLSEALGYLLSRSQRLLAMLLRDLMLVAPASFKDAEVRLQTGRRRYGITDIEVYIPKHVHVILEVKKGASLPTRTQLSLYARVCARSDVEHKKLIALTSLDDPTGHLEAEFKPIAGVVILVRSWRWVRRLVRRACVEERFVHVKFALEQYLRFLEGFMGLERTYSNMVYVVSIGSGNPRSWKLSWIDIVEQHHKYFYPFNSKNWPLPPNYLGFRYDGRLQSIHHVKRFQVVDDIRKCFPGAEGGKDWGRYYLFDLGPAIRPPHEVRTGTGIRWSARVRCVPDLLLTSRTISDALTMTKRREAAAERVA